MDGGSGNNAAILHAYLTQALAVGPRRAPAEEYSHLLQSIRSMKQRLRQAGTARTGADQQLACLFNVLTKKVSKVDYMLHKSLLGELLGMNVWVVSKELRGAILDLVTHLMVAKGEVVLECHKFLAGNLQPPPQPPKPDEASSKWEMPQEEKDIQDDVIISLIKVHKLIPTLPPLLVGELQSRVPHKLRDLPSHCIFFRGIFELARRTNAPAIREGILGISVYHLLSLDVEIRWEHITSMPEEEEADERDDTEEDVFDLEEQAEHLRLGGTAQETAGPSSGTRNHRDGFEGNFTRHPAQDAGAGQASTSGATGVDKLDTETVEKLDVLMEATLSHLENRLSAGDGPALWCSLLQAFNLTILPTFRVKFTQYLIWYMCAKGSPTFSAEFVQMLLGGLQSSQATPSMRSACVAYLASFLARAAFIPDTLLLSSLDSLASWSLNYLQTQDRSSGGKERAQQLEADQQHQVFYAATQALLYVLCFRMEHLARQPTCGAAPAAAAGLPSCGKPAAGPANPVSASLHLLFQKALPKLLGHRLAPLLRCNPSVTAEFAQLTGRLGLMDCGPLLPQEGSGRQQRPLEMFFPFDPYLLPASARLLDLPQSYIRWHGGHPRTMRAHGPLPEPDGDADSDASSDDEIPHPGDAEESERSSDSGSSSSSYDSDSDAEDVISPDRGSCTDTLAPSHCHGNGIVEKEESAGLSAGRHPCQRSRLPYQLLERRHGQPLLFASSRKQPYGTGLNRRPSFPGSRKCLFCLEDAVVHVKTDIHKVPFIKSGQECCNGFVSQAENSF
eukprot:jgi/Botrbrau1/22009/Bobra.0024s0025.1